MQRMWIGVVALVGVGLAFFLFQRPDTGDVETPDRTNTRPLDFDAAAEGTVRNPEVVAEGKAKRPRAGRKEGMERLMELRSQPDAVYAGKLIGPWTAIRFTLMKEFPDDSEGAAIAEDIKPILHALQVGRRDPTQQPPLADTTAQLGEIADRVRASSSLMDNETIASAVKRHDTTIAEFNSVASQGAGTAAPPVEEDQAP